MDERRHRGTKAQRHRGGIQNSEVRIQNWGRRWAAWGLGGAILLAGCTVHPKGEAAERAAATQAGTEYARRFEERKLPELAADAAPEQLVAYALLTNPEVEQKYWEWRSALEMVPQEGTVKTNVMISLSGMISQGATAQSMWQAGIGNDSAMGIPLPPKLTVAAGKALEMARVAAIRFDKARFDVRAKVLTAYYDYALSAELVRLHKQNVGLMESTTKVIQNRIASGMNVPADLLRTSNEIEMARNDLAAAEALLPGQRAAINALLSRDPRTAISEPAAIPATGELALSDEELVSRAGAINPEVRALAQEMVAKKIAIAQAKLEYLLDFNINFTSDLAGVTQSLMSSVSLPLLRYQAIDAMIRQAQADLRVADNMRRKMADDMRAQVIMDVTMLRDAERQVTLIDKKLLPRAQEVVDLTRRSYGNNQAIFLDVIETQRSLIGLRRMGAQMRAEREKRLVALEAMTASELRREVVAATVPATGPAK